MTSSSFVTSTAITGITSPRGIAVDGSGNLYVTGYNASSQSCLFKETLSGGTWSQSVVTCNLYGPTRVAVDDAGNLYVAESNRARIVKETLSPAGYTETVIDNASTPPYGVSFPTGISVDGLGNVYISDKNQNRVLRLSPSGGSYTQSIVADSSTGLQSPAGLEAKTPGLIVIADTTGNYVVALAQIRTVPMDFGTVAPGGTSAPQSVRVINNGNRNLTISGLTFTSGFEQTAGSGTPADCSITTSLAPNAACNLSLVFKPPAGSPVGAFTGLATLRDNDASNSDSTQNFTLTGTVSSTGQAPAFTSANTATFTVGVTGSFLVSATGTPAPTLTQSGALPGGLSFTPSTGVLSGVPAAGTGGSYPISFTATNSAGSASQSFTLTVNQAPAITSANNATFAAGTPGIFMVVATGYPAPTLVVNGQLPDGVMFAPLNGQLSGIPPAGTGGVYAITFTATNSVDHATQNFTLTINEAPVFTSVNSTTFTANSAGTYTVTATGYPAPTFAANGLPTGVSLTASGLLSGTATTAGVYQFPLTAHNGVGTDATQSFTLTVTQAPALTSANSTTFTVGTAGSFTVTASGYPAPTLSQSGTLPGGVTFDPSSGALGGTPAIGSGGMYPITFTAHNGVAPDATQSFTLTINQAPAINTEASATFTVGSPGSFLVKSSGYPKPSLSIGNGSLPSGVTFTDNGGGIATLSGTPAAGTGASYGFTITAHNGVGADATQSFTLAVSQAPAITSANSTTFAASSAGTFTATATGYPAPTFTETGALPSGVTFTAAGVLSGTTTATGVYPITITAHNGIGSDATQSFTLTVNKPPTITSSNNVTFTVGSPRSFTVTASGFPAPTLSVGNALPSGVAFNPSTGVLSGAPTVGAGGVYSLTFTATNSAGSSSQTFTLTVNQAPAITSPNVATFTVGVAGSFTVMATGYPAPAVSETGALPDGIAFNASTGVLSGVPAAGTAGTYAIVFSAGNGVGSTAMQSFTLTVSPGAALRSITVTPANSSLAEGLTLQYRATGIYSDGSSAVITDRVTWASSKPAFATISGSGLATALAPGTSLISATLGSITGATSLAVTAPALVSISVIPPNQAIAVGGRQQFAATGTYTDGSTKTITSSVTWTSSAPSVATVTAGGLATGVGVGSTIITATRGSISGTASLTVSPALVSIAITPSNPSIKVGATQQFTATGTYSDRSTQILTSGVTWSRTGNAATIDGKGLATGVAAGKSNIMAKLAGVTGVTSLTVTK